MKAPNGPASKGLLVAACHLFPELPEEKSPAETGRAWLQSGGLAVSGRGDQPTPATSP
jgi:hypothetical protein